LKKPLKVQFWGEQGIDEGGVRKEFFSLIIERLFDANFGMFLLKNERFFWFNHNSFECRLNFELVGSVLGLAIYNSDLLELKFPQVVYKKLLGETALLEDLEEFEPDLFSSLNNMRKMDKGVIKDLGLNFTLTYDNFGAPVVAN
jgi:hypothetical protein